MVCVEPLFEEFGGIASMNLMSRITPLPQFHPISPLGLLIPAQAHSIMLWLCNGAFDFSSEFLSEFDFRTDFDFGRAFPFGDEVDSFGSFDSFEYGGISVSVTHYFDDGTNSPRCRRRR